MPKAPPGGEGEQQRRAEEAQREDPEHSEIVQRALDEDEGGPPEKGGQPEGQPPEDRFPVHSLVMFSAATRSMSFFGPTFSKLISTR